MEEQRPPINAQCICGFDSAGEDTLCRKGPYKKGSLLKMVIRPIRSFRIESVIMSENQEVSITRIKTRGGVISSDEITNDHLVYRGCLLAEKGEPLEFVMRLKERQDRVTFCVFGSDCESEEMS